MHFLFLNFRSLTMSLKNTITYLLNILEFGTFRKLFYSTCLLIFIKKGGNNMHIISKIGF